MSLTIKISFIVIGVVLLTALILGAGVLLGRTSQSTVGFGPDNWMGWSFNNIRPGSSMMGNGMMGNNRYVPAVNLKPLTIDQVKQAVMGYLKGLNNPDFEPSEIMIFSNHAYARITEKSTGIGAMEVLIDPVSLSVFPEYGPNMMWNLKYGHMSGAGMMGSNFNRGNVSATMTVSSDQAVKIAQLYLDQQFPGTQAAPDAEPFYGYYTIDTLKDGKPAGMLSVNGFSGQVFLHTWHGTFIEMSE